MDHGAVAQNDAMVARPSFVQRRYNEGARDRFMLTPIDTSLAAAIIADDKALIGAKSSLAHFAPDARTTTHSDIGTLYLD